jgi:GGDEF domain-containing protein
VHHADIHLSASIGICLYPDDAATLDEMYSLSDKAMYAIKDAGRNGICFVSDLEPHQN